MLSWDVYMNVFGHLSVSNIFNPVQDSLGRVHDNVHDDMNMSLIMDDHSLFIAMINISSPMINSLS